MSNAVIIFLPVILHSHTHAHTSQVKYIRANLEITVYDSTQFVLKNSLCRPRGTHVTGAAWEASVSSVRVLTFGLFYCSHLALSWSPPCAHIYTRAAFDSLLLLAHLPLID